MSPQGPTPEQIAARNDSLVTDRTMPVNEVLAQIARDMSAMPERPGTP